MSNNHLRVLIIFAANMVLLIICNSRNDIDDRSLALIAVGLNTAGVSVFLADILDTLKQIAAKLKKPE